MDTTNDSNTSLNQELIRPFNVSVRDIHYEPETEETPLPNEELSVSIIQQEAETVQFEVFPEGSKRGKPLLVSSDGFRYSVKKNQKHSVLLICSSRSLNVKCYATVIQKGGDFVRGPNSHQHGPEVSLNEKMFASVNVKTSARSHPYKSATEIGIEVRDSTIASNQPGVPVPEYLLYDFANSHITKKVHLILITCISAACLAVREVFPGVTIKGCVFHFVQSVWRKIQDLGLKQAYSKRARIYNNLRLFTALPFLPYNHIEQSFRELASRANSEPLHDLVDYIENEWLNHPIFDIESWSVFNLTVRTNNDVEGWHHRLNRKAGYQPLTFYRLVPALRSEAESIAYELRHIRDGVSTRRVRPPVKTVEEKIRVLWDKYCTHTNTPSALLAGCAEIYGPQCEGPPPTCDEPMVTRL